MAFQFATIMGAISAAKAATDVAEKIKKTFWDDMGATSRSFSGDQPDIADFQNELVSKLEVLEQQVLKNAQIIEKQNEIIIHLSNAVEITASAIRNLKILLTIALSSAILAFGISGYLVLFT